MFLDAFGDELVKLGEGMGHNRREDRELAKKYRAMQKSMADAEGESPEAKAKAQADAKSTAAAKAWVKSDDVQLEIRAKREAARSLLGSKEVRARRRNRRFHAGVAMADYNAGAKKPKAKHVSYRGGPYGGGSGGFGLPGRKPWERGKTHSPGAQAQPVPPMEMAKKRGVRNPLMRPVASATLKNPYGPGTAPTPAPSSRRRTRSSSPRRPRAVAKIKQKRLPTPPATPSSDSSSSGPSRQMQRMLNPGKETFDSFNRGNRNSY
ncbi:hypothetical protein DRQ25_05150 [Candidatus Fermentibacteria bacterium]|nr:MAG: hypothetical protein DRQ25_05150 [Candidatus Fermentibacteria bacterium]